MYKECLYHLLVKLLLLIQILFSITPSSLEPFSITVHFIYLSLIKIYQIKFSLFQQFLLIMALYIEYIK